MNAASPEFVIDTNMHASFELERKALIPSLGITVLEAVHKKTGARHVHLACDHSENVFLVALATIPTNSTGVAHILEHTTLCGSERFPVRDPFFSMMHRSLNTFMNAFTSSDWTAYPFATQNRQDFQNLLEVYLDAVFFSRLDEQDFRQEGHRLEFQDRQDPDSPLEIKGVVYNEMKGAMSSASRQIFSSLTRAMFDTSTYHHNSGGQVESIAQLSFEQLTAFYKSHYHPSNAVFFTFGDIAAHEHQAQFERWALSRFEASQRIAVDLEVRRFAPRYLEEAYTSHEAELGEQDTYITLAWLLPEGNSAQDRLEYELLHDLLIGHSASPLSHALETSGLGSPSSYNGLMKGTREPMFCVGLQGCQRNDRPKVEQLVTSTLASIVATGFSNEAVEACLFQLEMSQKQITGSSYPYGLELILNALSPLLYGQSVMESLDIEPNIAQLRNDALNPGYLTQKLSTLLLENRHQVIHVMYPDVDLARLQAEHETEQLQARKAALTAEQVQTILAQGQALAERQARKDDPSILPNLTLADIPSEQPGITHADQSRLGSPVPIHFYDSKTNGLSFVQIISQLPALSIEQARTMQQLLLLWTEVGHGQHSYLDVQKAQFAVSGYLTTRLSIRNHPFDPHQLSGYSVLTASTLDHRFTKLHEQMQAQFFTPRFDELNRMQEMLIRSRQRVLNSVANRGHSLALSAASACYSAYDNLSHQLSGLEYIQAENQAKDRFRALQDVETTAVQLQQVHQLLTTQPRQILLVGDTPELDSQLNLLENWQQGISPVTPLTANELRPREHQAWLGSTQVNFCALALPAVTRDQLDAPILEVMSNFISQEYLHTRLREQGGAYGGGLSFDQHSATLKFYTYRDPRIAGSYADFDSAMVWAAQTAPTQSQLESAILSIISSIDKPSSPSGEATSEYFALLHGRTLAQRQAFRTKILAVTPEQVLDCAQRYLKPDTGVKVVVTSRELWQKNQIDGFTVHQI